MSLAGWCFSPERLFRLSGQRILIEGSRHAMGRGALARLERTPDGGWRVEPLAQLPGAVNGIGFDPEGHLLLLFEQIFAEQECPDSGNLTATLPALG